MTKQQKLKRIIELMVRKQLKESFASNNSEKMDKIFNIIGYEDWYDFISDNPGAAEVLLDWISSNFDDQLQDSEYTKSELEDLGLYVDWEDEPDY